MSRHNKLMLIIIITILVGALYWVTKTTSKNQSNTHTEEQRIDAWITSHNLNEYGDRSDTNYTGGTPLFNEANGQNENRYHYIIRTHPDKPWNQ